MTPQNSNILAVSILVRLDLGYAIGVSILGRLDLGYTRLDLGFSSLLGVLI